MNLADFNTRARSPAQAQSIAEAVKRLKTAKVHPQAGLYGLFLG